MHMEDLRYSLGVRQLGYQLFANRSDFFFAKTQAPNKTTYMKEMASSKFCLSMFGWVPWSGRLAHLLKGGCIPVIVADGIVLPFDDIIDWRSFSVKISHDNIDQLPYILNSITVSQAWELFQALLLARQKLLYSKPPLSGGALQSLVLSLDRRVPIHRVTAFDSWPMTLG